MIDEERARKRTQERLVSADKALSGLIGEQRSALRLVRDILLVAHAEAVKSCPDEGEGDGYPPDSILELLDRLGRVRRELKDLRASLRKEMEHWPG